jgi:uncharacterized protein YgiM (DUF1202 family)
MKLNCCLLLAVTVAVSATAQTSTNSLPAIPPPLTGSPAPVAVPAPVVVTADAPTNAPAKKAVAKKKKKAVAKAKPAKLAEPTTTLAAGSAEVLVNNVNVRGQAGLKGEVIAHVQKGDMVDVISQISLDKHKADEPSQWAKITLPTNVTVWVDSKYITADKTVSVKKLNLRAGPGENYSVLGVVEKGASVTEAGAKGNWTKIEPPTNAYAFIAAMYLKQEASGNIPVNPAPSTETPTPTPTTVADTTGMVAPPPSGSPTTSPDTAMVAPAPQIPPVIIQTNIIVVTDTNVPPPPPRIVTHEGNVRRSVSLVAPTYFELYDPSTGIAINYLYSSTTNLNLARYDGFKISVTGEEGLDPRWERTPVLTVQKIYVLAGAPAPAPLPADKTKNTRRGYHFW